MRVENHAKVIRELMISRGITSQTDLAERMSESEEEPTSQQAVWRQLNAEPIAKRPFIVKFADAINATDEERIRLAVSHAFGRYLELVDEDVA